MIAARRSWQVRFSSSHEASWRREDSDGHVASVLRSKNPTDPFLWAVYPGGGIGPPLRAGYCKSLDDALHAANEAFLETFGPRNYAEGEECGS